MARLAGVLLLLAGLGLAAATDYTTNGPCAMARVDKLVTVLPSSTGCRLNECLLKVIVTLPSGGDGCPAGPYPVVWFFSGFSSRAGFYSYLANRLASYGYAVVQYNPTALIITDAVETTFVAAIRTFLQGQPAGSPLDGKLDWSREATAGHSRGGKLAALQLAAAPAEFETAFLIDPIDNTMFSPEGPDYPSAVKALAALDPKKAFGLIGAGVPSACNPPEANYTGFWAEAAPGSWFEFIPGATHADFINIVPGANIPLPPVCGKGTTPAEEVQQLTATTMTAWFESFFRGASMLEFDAWILFKVEADVVGYEVKQ
ncbi:hypothetical protein Rsub_07717 [Raphidocelis subcapitata]|uniref:Chlorophyllase n=1 Tax=Raphidocelis subcapitata TaxID=307507 RepID=A0A2V0PB59_9CHLO|nr:hypothetical protein Rsub_07717 [Raphidocelis subcapitata]|eukprot:GBF95133.1 hypothetical protein Rsub_07717 [Raphidocelis subcapitata]